MRLVKYAASYLKRRLLMRNDLAKVTAIFIASSVLRVTSYDVSIHVHVHHRPLVTLAFPRKNDSTGRQVYIIRHMYIIQEIVSSYFIYKKFVCRFFSSLIISY